MKKFLSALPSKQILILCGILLCALLIWFAGPYLSFGGLHPFASVSMRVTFIVMMFALVLFFLQSWPMSILGVTAACLLLWHAGPLLTLGAIQPFASLWIRIPLLLIIIGTYALTTLAPLWQSLGINNHFFARFFKKAGDDVANNELRIVNGIIQQAMSQLKNMRSSTSGIRRLFEGRRYLYELPWYMIIGTPGAGKTTALINSGMKFPLAEQIKASTGTLTQAGQGGTAHCDWWFTNDAVLIDTAGRYSSQEMDKVKDNAEWHGFLNLLRKRRTQSPINGAIVTISLADFLMQTEEERLHHATMLRERLIELHQELGIRFPVYVMITKMDLLAGFSEYYHHLSSEDLAQVWGFTLPYSSASKNGHDATTRPLSDLLSEEFAALATRLEDGLILRLREEYDPERRRALYALPQEFGSMSKNLTSMIEAIFADSRFDQTQVNQGLRGVYFTSAAQAQTSIPANKTSLLQRLRKAFTGEDNLQRDPASLLPSHKRSYFLSNLFSKVIIPDANLVRPNLRWEFKFGLFRLACHIGIGMIALWLMGALIVSFDNNNAYLNKVAAKVAAFRPVMNNIEHRVNYQNVAALSDVLTTVKKLPLSSDFDITQPPATLGFGLYTAPAVADASNHLYAQMQEDLLIPQFVHHLENVLRHAVETRNTALAYDTLRIYLQLHQRDKFNADDIKNWAEQDWKLTQKAPAFGPNTAAMQHLIYLFSTKRIIQSTAQPNIGLVQKVRQFLETSSSTPHIYRTVKAHLLRDDHQYFSLTQAIGTEADGIYKSQQGNDVDHSIPHIFTYDGYHNTVKNITDDTIQTALEEHAWIMGKDNVEAASASLMNGIYSLYLQDYTRQWKSYLNDLHIVKGQSIESELMLAKNMAQNNSPFARLARAIVHETTLSVDVAVNTDNHFFSKIAAHFSNALQDDTGVTSEDQLLKTLVDKHFADVREFVTGHQMMTPLGEEADYSLDGFAGLFKTYYQELVTAHAAVKSDNIPANTLPAAQKIALMAGNLPMPLKTIVQDLLDNNQAQLDDATEQFIRPKAQQTFNQIMEALAPVSLGFRTTIEGKYPFAASAHDVSLEDFTSIFAPDSQADIYFKTFLQPYVNNAGATWSYKKPSDMKADNAEDLAVKKEVLHLLMQYGPKPNDFAHFYTIQDTFFSHGNTDLILSGDLQVSDLDPHISELVMNIDGQRQRYAHGPQQRMHIQWPGPRGGILASLSTVPEMAGSTVLESGPWALLRLLDKAQMKQYEGSTMAMFTLGRYNTTLKLSPNVYRAKQALRSFSYPRGKQ